MSVSDAYRCLDVPPEAPMHVIRRAYTSQVVQYHPDTAPDGGSPRQLGQVLASHRVVLPVLSFVRCIMHCMNDCAHHPCIGTRTHAYMHPLAPIMLKRGTLTLTLPPLQIQEAYELIVQHRYILSVRHEPTTRKWAFVLSAPAISLLEKTMLLTSWLWILTCFRRQADWHGTSAWHRLDTVHGCRCCFGDSILTFAGPRLPAAHRKQRARDSSGMHALRSTH
jgi:hypothetical protein